MLLRALREPDAFPAGDLGLRRALGCDARELERRAERMAALARLRRHAALDDRGERAQALRADQPPGQFGGGDFRSTEISSSS